MLLAYADMLHAPVAAADVGEKIGTVTDVIVDPETHTVLAFVIRPGGLFAGLQFVSPQDVIEYDPHALIVASGDALVPTSDILRAQTMLRQHVHVLRRSVMSESGDNLGKVNNFAIDTETAGVVRYYVHALFGQERIIPTKSIVQVTDKAFIISDTQLKVHAKHSRSAPIHN